MNNIDMIYSPELETLIKIKGEECDILSKLHLMSHKKYKKVETYYNIPIITISACVGFISAVNINFQYMNIIIGLLSLYVSLLKSYFSYLQISQKSENHRVSYLQYFQITNEIRIELALAPELRQPANYLLNLIKVKMKNLNEVSEIVSNFIIQEFISDHEKCDLYSQISKPDVLNLVSPIYTYKNIVDEEANEQKTKNDKNNDTNQDNDTNKNNDTKNDTNQESKNQE